MTGSPLGPGTVVAARYEILGTLGIGGMGVVYKARDRKLDDLVALKVLRFDVPLDPDRERRFRHEIKLAWRVRHKNVCGIHEYGEDGDWKYISMELVEGSDLKRILRERGPLPWNKAFDIVIQAAEGLHAIHEVGIIHRDLKSSNLTVDDHGLVRLMDFGIAKESREGSSGGLTQTGQVVGSPEYMSPEQVWAQPLDFRSDIYSLGVVVFETFTGHVPFRGDTLVATILKHLHELPPLEGPEAFGLPLALVPVLRRALAKDAKERPATALELAEALRAARAVAVSEVRPTAPRQAPALAASTERPTADTIIPAPHVDSPPPASGPAKEPPQARLLIPPLLRALKHSDRDLRAAAAEALGRMGPEAAAALKPLIKALSDEWASVRVQAVRALAKLGPEARAAAPAISERLGDADERVRAAAAKALAKLVLVAGEPSPKPAPAAAPAAPPAQSEMPAAAPTPGTSFKARIARFTFDMAKSSTLGPALRRARRGLRLLATPYVGGVLLLVALATYGIATRRPIDPRVSIDPATSSTPSTRVPSSEPAVPTVPPVASPGVSPAPPSAPTPGGAPTTAPKPKPRSQLTPATPSPTPTPTPTPEATPTPTIASAPTPVATPVPTPTPVARGMLVSLGDPDVVAPQLKSAPRRPVFPDIALIRGIKGEVEVNVLVDEDGDVAEARTVKGPAELRKAAEAYARGRTYRPATKYRVPVKVWISITVQFVIEK